MLGGQKRGVHPNPLEPPLCTGLVDPPETILKVIIRVRLTIILSYSQLCQQSVVCCIGYNEIV